MTHRVTVKVAGLQPVQVLAALTGIAFIAIGVVGFTRTGGTGNDHAFVLGFAVNPMHNAVHVVFGVLGLLMAMRSGLARLYGWLLFLGYGAVFVWGLMISGVITVNPVSDLGNPLALNTNDNWLHLGIAVLGLFLAVLPARRKLIEVDEADEADERRDVPEPRVEEMDPTVSPRPATTKHTTTAPSPADTSDTERLPKQKKDESTHTIKS
ncbi:hypothetical protein Lesp02_68560 [Lentzea sp. NBRC 105346]|uniref:DUF4383 domain-containing protein n=1 Tax=Lentzea sp. NBRC 105346 TaxID=3032205 RepID=UPI0024A36914|nr:DUF4383 domain-containing protein [Lentzea sp. NBRC 105346]GLZ34669.1 hypothetical protein Lesp02_68560 [Lentzea sp. NBRC 105346]